MNQDVPLNDLTDEEWAEMRAEFEKDQAADLEAERAYLAMEDEELQNHESTIHRRQHRLCSSCFIAMEPERELAVRIHGRWMCCRCQIVSADATCFYTDPNHPKLRCGGDHGAMAPKVIYE